MQQDDMELYKKKYLLPNVPPAKGDLTVPYRVPGQLIHNRCPSRKIPPPDCQGLWTPLRLANGVSDEDLLSKAKNPHQKRKRSPPAQDRNTKNKTGCSAGPRFLLGSRNGGIRLRNGTQHHRKHPEQEFNKPASQGGTYSQGTTAAPKSQKRT